ncbi:hypothetical protein NPIL_314461 [Nephila pilipes]|uniref:Uncharacterized protein n=1 Tax=Nephila pilipes TaxID=299642 RepID=A0A8X6U076_NEPPI|nr:hypothetical protein NPIL_314461 [Nephila pilipes]
MDSKPYLNTSSKSRVSVRPGPFNLYPCTSYPDILCLSHRQEVALSDCIGEKENTFEIAPYNNSAPKRDRVSSFFITPKDVWRQF